MTDKLYAAQRLAQLEGPWEDHSFLNGQHYNSASFQQQASPDLQGSQLQGHFATEAQPGYLENSYGQRAQHMDQYRLPPDIAARSAQTSLLDGLSHADLRTALQHPQTARYIKQLEMEALWAAKTQNQPKVSTLTSSLPRSLIS